MAPNYKLTYFDTPGLGEPLRYLFAVAGLEFEDIRLPKGTKPDTEFGKVPILEVDGKVLNQSAAIGRFLAKEAGLYGTNDWEAAQSDAIVDTLSDLRLLYYPYFQEKDESKKPQILEEILKTHNPFYFSRFEKIVTENGGYFVNNQLTWADIFFVCTANIVMFVIQNEAILDDYPALKALQEKVENLPGLKEYIAKRKSLN